MPEQQPQEIGGLARCLGGLLTFKQEGGRPAGSRLLIIRLT